MNIESTQAFTSASLDKDHNFSPADKAPADNKNAVLTETSIPSDTASKKENEVEVKEVKKASEPVVIDKEKLEVMAQKLQDFVGSLNRGLEFSVHDDSGRDVIKVIDKNTGDTVKQYPSEEVLDLVASLSDAAGTFINMKA